MPGRNIPLITDQKYHVFNRGAYGQQVFKDRRSYDRFLELLFYYQFAGNSLRYSRFLKLSRDQRESIYINLLNKKDYIVRVHAFCLMPSHFHLLLQQSKNTGIAKFIGNISNGYTRFLNVKNETYGPIFQGKFKAVLIESGEQYIHVTRYIHLNPYTSYIVKSREDLLNYPYSSLPMFLNLNKESKPLVHKQDILSYFKSVEALKEFTLDQKDYQRRLAAIKHLTLET